MKQLLSLFIILAGISTELCAQEHVNYRIIMRNRGEYTLWDGVTINTYGFALKLTEQPGIPGPTLTANEGDTVTIKAWNVSQGEPHTIHLHGLDVDQANDGVAHTSFDIKHMEEKSYTFVATHAGTYLYHCHVASVVHLQMGMYGLIKIFPKNGAKTAWTGGPQYDSEYSWLTSEVDKKWHDAPPESDHTDTTDLHHPVTIPEYVPTYFLVNGKSHWQLAADSSIFISAKTNDRVYLRLANIGYFENRVIFPQQLGAQVIDSDGRPLPEALRQDTVILSPGERYGVMLTSDALLKDSIEVQYINMNTYQLWKSHFIPVTITGTSSISEELPAEASPRAYPNPADETVTLMLSNELADIQVINTVGQCVAKFTSHQKEFSFKTADIPAGAYSVVITTGFKTRVLPLHILH